MVQLLYKPVPCSDKAFLNNNLSFKVALKCVLFQALLFPCGLAEEIYWEGKTFPAIFSPYSTAPNNLYFTEEFLLLCAVTPSIISLKFLLKKKSHTLKFRMNVSTAAVQRWMNEM